MKFVTFMKASGGKTLAFQIKRLNTLTGVERLLKITHSQEEADRVVSELTLDRDGSGSLFFWEITHAG